MYKLADEPPLAYSMLVAMDGNSSMKLVDTLFKSGTPRLDDRAARSAIWLTPEQVDIFKDEVNGPRKV